MTITYRITNVKIYDLSNGGDPYLTLDNECVSEDGETYNTFTTIHARCWPNQQQGAYVGPQVTGPGHSGAPQFAISGKDTSGRLITFSPLRCTSNGGAWDQNILHWCIFQQL